MARKVLLGKTKGYRFHPQLQRFKESSEPLLHIDHYLSHVYQEALKRGYRFDAGKIVFSPLKKKLVVSRGQLEYEFQHLMNKLKIRDRDKFLELKKINKLSASPFFRVVKGKLADWEKI